MRDPLERALSAYYYIAMSDRRAAAVNAVRLPAYSYSSRPTSPTPRS